MSSGQCEICDRDPRDVCRDAWRHYLLYGGAVFQGRPNPYPGPLPAGDAKGWSVVFNPARRFFRHGPGNSFSQIKDYDLSRGVSYAIYTCGDAICMFRARIHGVPGKDHLCRVPKIDEWLQQDRNSP